MSRGWFFLSLVVAFPFAAAGADRGVEQIRQEPGVFVGAVGCKSSSCHGGAGEKRSQYITWSSQDFHTRAYPILLNARSQRMAESLALGDATNSARCTACHAPFQSVPASQKSATVHSDEGVSCENCHGAAGGWLRGHTRPDWTYAMRVSAGMRDLKSLYARANACVACHQNVAKDLLAAGHPALLFELDEQSVNQPKHWRDEDPHSGIRAWLTGQAVALRESAWQSRTDADPADDTQQTAMALAWLLAKVTMTDPALPQIVEPDSADLERLQKQADALAHRAASWQPNEEGISSALRALADTSGEFRTGKEPAPAALPYRARRAVRGIERLLIALNQTRGVPLNIDAELKLLREDVAPSGTFDPTRFAEHLRALRQKL